MKAVQVAMWANRSQGLPAGFGVWDMCQMRALLATILSSSFLISFSFFLPLHSLSLSLIISSTSLSLSLIFSTFLRFQRKMAGFNQLFYRDFSLVQNNEKFSLFKGLKLNTYPPSPLGHPSPGPGTNAFESDIPASGAKWPGFWAQKRTRDVCGCLLCGEVARFVFSLQSPSSFFLSFTNKSQKLSSLLS